MQYKIGKAKVKIEVEGCAKCGGRWSNGWYVYKEVEIQIGKKKGTVSISICADCKNQEEHGAEKPFGLHSTLEKL